jgi:hypothetical protein
MEYRLAEWGEAVVEQYVIEQVIARIKLEYVDAVADGKLVAGCRDGLARIMAAKTGPPEANEMPAPTKDAAFPEISDMLAHQATAARRRGQKVSQRLCHYPGREIRGACEHDEDTPAAQTRSYRRVVSRAIACAIGLPAADAQRESAAPLPSRLAYLWS